MAAGSSAPELATVIIGVFFAKDDIGELTLNKQSIGVIFNQSSYYIQVYRVSSAQPYSTSCLSFQCVPSSLAPSSN